MPQIVCTCGIEAAVRVQKKEGPKQGTIENKTFSQLPKKLEYQERPFTAAPSPRRSSVASSNGRTTLAVLVATKEGALCPIVSVVPSPFVVSSRRKVPTRVCTNLNK